MIWYIYIYMCVWHDGSVLYQPISRWYPLLWQLLWPPQNLQPFIPNLWKPCANQLLKLGWIAWQNLCYRRWRMEVAAWTKLVLCWSCSLVGFKMEAFSHPQFRSWEAVALDVRCEKWVRGYIMSCIHKICKRMAWSTSSWWLAEGDACS